MRRKALAVAVGLIAGLSVGGAPVATADPAPAVSAAPARVDHVDMLTDRRAAMFVNSPALGRVVQVQVLLPADRSTSRPSLYMLDGLSAGQETNYTESTWTAKTDIVPFFADKDVNVVLPIGGRGSYYADWLRPDPALGVNMWETFLTKELPPLVDAQFDGNGTNSIVGLSMGAQAAMNLITKYPSLYTGIAAFSGCYSNDSENEKNAIRATVASVGGNTDNMWGPSSDPQWQINDPSLHVDALRGKQVYIATGNGFPGPYEQGFGNDIIRTLSVGGPLEVAANLCTREFAQTLSAAHVSATFVFRPWGSHSWGYWQDDLHDSWPTLKRALGL
ncbi:alpha/beta hydrolase [Actinomycetes bacterium M1A6_2h]